VPLAAPAGQAASRPALRCTTEGAVCEALRASVGGAGLCGSALASHLTAATLSRELSPRSLLRGVVLALEAAARERADEGQCERLCRAVQALDAALSAAQRAPPLLGGGEPGGFQRAVRAALSSELQGAQGAQAIVAARALAQLLHSSRMLPAARALLLQLLLLGADSSAASLLEGWPELLPPQESHDVLAAAVSLAAHCQPLTPQLAEPVALRALELLADGTCPAHAPVRALELLARRCGWDWACATLLEPHLLPALRRAEPAAARAAGALLLVALAQPATCAHQAAVEAQQLLCALLAPERTDEAALSAAEAAADIHARAVYESPMLSGCLASWWASLPLAERKRLPQRVTQRLTAVGFTF
jgi:hypothetical protein